MTGIELNAEALAEKEYRQDELSLRHFEIMFEFWDNELKRAERAKQLYTEKIQAIHKKRKGSHEQR